jgi:tRNA nucleotidyltransferase (CCA-adding enzyme)
MKRFLVGGAVRDKLLELPVKDRDWVVIGSTPEEMLGMGYRQVGADFPVFLHPDTQEEHALARTERKSGTGYKGFICDFSPDITLEDDLGRRDLTINAMAQDESGQIVDPFGGQQDLQNRTLRHVSRAFREDPLRVFRVARFATRLAPLGFTVADETLVLMREMTVSGELDSLTAERVWQETQKALGYQTPSMFFKVLHYCGALRSWFPEIAALFGIPQTAIHHPEIDAGVHTLMTLDMAATLSEQLDVRFAALVHDLGKALTPAAEWPRHIKHESRGIKPIESLCDRLKVPKTLRELGILASREHLNIHRADELKAATMLKLFDRCDLWRRPERFSHLLRVCEADARGRKGLESREYTVAPYLQALAGAARGVRAAALLAEGVTTDQLPLASTYG